MAAGMTITESTIFRDSDFPPSHKGIRIQWRMLIVAKGVHVTFECQDRRAQAKMRVTRATDTHTHTNKQTLGMRTFEQQNSDNSCELFYSSSSVVVSVSWIRMFRVAWTAGIGTLHLSDAHFAMSAIISPNVGVLCVIFCAPICSR